MSKLGSYTLGERLGLGGMAEVFEAHSPEHGRVALKRILPSLAEERDFADMFWDEARVTSRLDHPNVIRVLDYGRVNGQLFMALEYVDGPPVARVLRKAARAKKAIDLRAVLSMGAQLLSGLHFVHSATDERGMPLSIVHRDVSPGNILLTTDGQVKLGDFGIVRSEIVLRRTQPGELKGKIGYMSPEQVHGRPIDGRSDVFSAGVVLAELLILRPLLLGKSEMQTLNRTSQVDLTTWNRFNESVPRPVRAIVEKALRREPSERFQSADEMRQAILDVAQISGLGLGRSVVRAALAELDFLSGSKPHAAQSGEHVLGGRVLAASGEHERGEVLGTPPQAEGRPLWKMSYDQRSLPRQLMMALRRTRNGIVQLTRKDSSLDLEVRRGRIIAVHDSASDDKLGDRLVQAAIIGEAELALAITESRAAGVRLGEYLVQHRRVRESTLRRLLDEQTQARLLLWMNQGETGSLAVYLGPFESLAGGLIPEGDLEPESVEQLVSVLRQALPPDALKLHLAPVLDAVLLPTPGADAGHLGLTPPEGRALTAVLEGGACEGQVVREVLGTLTNERIARYRESAFALLVGLCSGRVHAPGF